jgi:zinc transporter
MTSHILQAYGFDRFSKAKELNGVEVTKKMAKEDLVWIHLDNAHEETIHWLQSELKSLDPVAIEALTEESTRPRLEKIGDGLLIILKGVSLDEKTDTEDLVALRVWVDAKRVITLARKPLKGISGFESKLESGQIEANAGSILSGLIHFLVLKMEPRLSLIDALLDEIEEEVLEKADPSLSDDLVSLRKKSILFKRYLLPQREVLMELLEVDVDWMHETSFRLLTEDYNKTARFIESLDAVRERAQIVRDELTTASNEKLNKNLYILSIITAIFLPLGFLTGLLGVNVGGIPGAENPQAFVYFCGILFVIIILQMLIFIKLKWF